MQTQKLVVIPDLHGNPIWKEIIYGKNFQKVVFLGDYFDSRNFKIGIEDEIRNFRDILEFKNQNSDRVVLLCGNHDLHYLNGVFGTCSGYQPENADKINSILQPFFDKQKLKMSYYDDHCKIMFSHAGISKHWFENMFDITCSDPEDIMNLINKLFWKYPGAFEYQQVDDDLEGNGESEKEGPCWIRPFSLLQHPFPFTQVVGHTQQKEVTKMGNVYFADTLNSGTGILEF
ncbi:MAG: metallophosphoesterase [Weeksellaceae bacterium]|nr:metallophosphoesterase [Bacteroidota bacterium]MCG2780378.1 metallophosphoesterase [Weeksellaceae bacterium]